MLQFLQPEIKNKFHAKFKSLRNQVICEARNSNNNFLNAILKQTKTLQLTYGKVLKTTNYFNFTTKR